LANIEEYHDSQTNTDGQLALVCTEDNNILSIKHLGPCEECSTLGITYVLLEVTQYKFARLRGLRKR